MDTHYLNLAHYIDDFLVDPEDNNISPQRVDQCFVTLIDVATEYFVYEEKIMRNINFPNYEHYKQFHERILYELKKYHKALLNYHDHEALTKVHDYLRHSLCHPLETENRMILNHIHRETAPADDIISQHQKRISKHPSILIVDDEPIDIQVLADILKRDYQVLFALSGKDGLRIAESHEPDIILLDVRMKDMDGFTVCRELKKNPLLKDIPVIFVTAMNEENNEAQGLEIGAIDYLAKPIQPIIVRNRIRNHLEFKIQCDTLRFLSVMDGLTGITNRRGFNEAFEREWYRAVRNNSEISLAMADIDHFKAYNDHYGHLAGDDCLRAVASIFHRQMLRPADLVARYGGEELICLLPDTDSVGARVVLERILANLATRAIPHESSMIARILTVSVGIATTRPTVKDSPDALLNLADRYLYEAKNSGRNQIKTGCLEADSSKSGES